MYLRLASNLQSSASTFFFPSSSAGVWTQDLHLEPPLPAFFGDGYFWDRVHELFAWADSEPWSS
jgi:hypothetical protein